MATGSLRVNAICRTVELGVAIINAATAEQVTRRFCALVTLGAGCRRVSWRADLETTFSVG